MTLQNIDIEAIVKDVLQQLQSTGATAPAASVPEQNGRAITLSQSVITADLLAEKVGKQGSVKLPSKAIVTPAARDYLKEHRIDVVGHCSKATSVSGTKNKNAPHWHGLIVAAPTPLEGVLKNLARSSEGKWSQELSNCTQDACETARREISRGSYPGIVICTEHAAMACCEVNRQQHVRGVVVKRPGDLDDVAEVNANVVCLPATGLTFMDYRQIFHHLMSRSGSSTEGNQ